MACQLYLHEDVTRNTRLMGFGQKKCRLTPQTSHNPCPTERLYSATQPLGTQRDFGARAWLQGRHLTSITSSWALPLQIRSAIHYGSSMRIRVLKFALDQLT